MIYYLSNRSRRKISINYEFSCDFFSSLLFWHFSRHVMSTRSRWTTKKKRWKIARFFSLTIFICQHFHPTRKNFFSLLPLLIFMMNKKKGSNEEKNQKKDLFFNEQQNQERGEIKPQKPNRPWTIFSFFSCVIIVAGPLLNSKIILILISMRIA